MNTGVGKNVTIMLKVSSPHLCTLLLSLVFFLLVSDLVKANHNEAGKKIMIMIAANTCLYSIVFLSLSLLP